MNKLTLIVIFLLPALGVAALYYAVKRDMRENASSDAQKPPATKVIRYAPPNVLPKRSAKGYCYSSRLIPYRSDAWRCNVYVQPTAPLSGAVVHDPCFSAPQSKQVVCDSDPARSDTDFILEHSDPLPPRDDLSTPPPDH